MSSIFARRFDHNNISNFLPDNKTVGTVQFFKNKLGDGLPDDYYELMEILSRPEYSKEDFIQVQQEMIKRRNEYNIKLLQEFANRELPN